MNWYFRCTDLYGRNLKAHLKGATKSYWKIIFVFATKIAENTTKVLNCNFQTKFTLLPIKLNTYMFKIKSTSHK